MEVSPESLFKSQCVVCASSFIATDRLTWNKRATYATLSATMDELGFTILRHDRKTPSLAMCQRCKIKFFTPRELSDDPIKAEAFLWGRFNVHKCKVQDFPVRTQKTAVNQ